MKWKWIACLTGLLLLVMVFMALVAIGAVRVPNFPRKMKGNRVVRKVEEFRGKNHRLPSDLKEAGIVTDQFFYQTNDATHYRVWFGAELGESVTYLSETDQWYP